MLIVFVLYLLWNLTVTLTRTLRHDDYKEFNTTICKGQCGKIACPLHTIMVIKMVRISQLNLAGGICEEGTPLRATENDEDLDNHCNKMFEVNISAEANSKCSHKSNCLVCHRRGMTKGQGLCAATAAVSVSHICISGKIIEEVVQANMYVDLSCADYVAHQIIIHNATLLPNEELKGLKKAYLDNGENSSCAYNDISSLVGRSCSGQYKCQAGPDMFIPKYCKARKLQIKYSCVPESILNLGSLSSNEDMFIQTKIPTRSVGKDSVEDPVVDSKKKAFVDDSDSDKLWIIIVVSLFTLAIFSTAALLFWYRYRLHLRRMELSTKIKNANFSPPPSSIEKIDLDLCGRNGMSTESSLLFHQFLNYEVAPPPPLGYYDYNFCSKTLSRCPTNIIALGATSCSLSAGSSGQISSYHSDSSKEHQSTVFNCVTQEKPSSDQTPL